jgi:hypothetical protein
MVYKGKERVTGREVAMKIVRAQDQIEFDDGSGGCPDDAYRFDSPKQVVLRAAGAVDSVGVGDRMITP